jgi:predicted permease
MGRALVADDGADVAVISHRLWRTEFGADPGMVGRVIEIDGNPVEVVGVMPAAFAAPRPSVDLWYRSPIETADEYRSSRYLQVVARLAPGVTREAAEAELNTVAARLGREYPQTNRGYGVELVAARDQVVGEASDLLVAILGAVSLLLLLAAVNVSNMLLGRAASRGHEYAVRSAIGGSAGRIRNQLVVESLVLGALAAAFGVGLAHLGVRALVRLEPDAIPRAAEISLDYGVLGLALLVSIGASAAVGLVPGLRAARVGPAPALRGGAQGSRGGSRDPLRRSLIVAELALSLVLLIAAGLLFRTFVALRFVDPGYATENVLTAKVSLDESVFRSSATRVRYFDDLAERLRALPGVRAVGVANTIPLDPTGIDFDLPYRREEDPPLPEEELPSVDYRIISPGYIDALGIDLLQGRGLAPSDRAGAARVLLINRAFADRLWPGEDAVGHRLVIHYVAEPALAWDVVGVVEDTRHEGLAAEPRPQFFVPIGQAEYLFGYMTIVVRTTGPVASVAEAVREAGLEVAPTEPLYELQTMAQLRATAVARERLAAALVGIFAALALLLSAAGVYGVVSYQVARRTREIGVRMALGAARRGVLALVLGEVALTAAAGLALGTATALLASRLLRGLLYGVTTTDVPTFAAVALILAATTLLAAWIPARRAASVDPVRALRTE